MSLPTELLKGTLKSLVLSLLKEDDKYGYQLIKELRERSKEALEIGEGSIYPALHSLEQKKLVKSYWKNQHEGPDRKYYHLTKKGQKELASAKEEWRSFTAAIQSIYGFQIS